MAVKHRINLLQPILVPEKHYLTLTSTVLVWALVLISTLGLTYHYHQQSNQLISQHAAVKTVNKQQEQLLLELQVLLNQQKVDTGLQAKLATLQDIYRAKQLLAKQLTDQNQVTVIGFANVMNELAKFHNPQVSLQRMFISADEVTLSGDVKQADAIPLWLAGFTGDSFLAGKSFAELSLNANEQGLTEFTVSSKRQQEQN